MKKALSLFLTFLIVINTFGLLVFYWSEIQICQSEALSISYQNFADENMISFSSSEHNVYCVNDHEILVEGKLFDVVKKVSENGHTLYYVMSDEKENDCIQTITDITKNNSGNNSLPGKTVTPQVLKYVCFKHKFIFQNENFISLLNNRNLYDDFLFYKSPLTSIFSPPPNPFVS